MKFIYLPKEKVAEIPKTPGVYSFWSQNKNLLYIGKAGNLRNRAKTHFAQPNYRDNLFIEQVKKIGYIKTDSEIEALLLESALIKELSPKYNVMWKDGKNYFFILITKESFPRVVVTHQKQMEGTYIGPFVDGKAVKHVLRSLRKAFPYYTKKHEKKLCQYCHLGLCPGPEPNREEYKKNIKNLTAILRGKRISVLKTLRNHMWQASKDQDFEQAGKLRDQLEHIEIIFSHAKIFRPDHEKALVHWTATEKDLQKIFKTKKRISRIEAYDISNTQGKESTSSMPVFIHGMPAKDQYRKFKIRNTGSPNDFAMLHETITRRLRHTEWPYPDIMIIDGGKGQLSSMLRAIRECNTKQANQILVAAIAKKNNELFFPGNPAPLFLKDTPQSVFNLILHIRDEAHRFAITYHRKLRKKQLLPR